MGDSNIRYADIIIDISHEALDKVFQYRVPLSLWEEVQPGSRVFVPFGRGNRETEGYVIAIRQEADYEESKIKEILRVNTEGISVESELIQVASFFKEKYGSTMIQALRTVLPVKTKMKPKEEVFITLSIEKDTAQQLLCEWERKHFAARARFLSTLLKKERMRKEEAVKTCNFPLKELRKLSEQGIIKLESRIKYRNPFPELVTRKQGWPLNDEQRAIVDNFKEEYRKGERRTYLLYGITGSGKTEVYLSLINEVLAVGRQVIVLIPEISLTYQTVRRFYERFGERIAVINSRMSKGEKSDACERIRAGEADVIIGARSALFAPTERLGLIVIDEEHDGAYKSDTSPKYHARETAIYRAKLCGASVVLGSATPSVEAYAHALNGEYQLWTLKKRAGNAILPKTQIVDLREEFKKGNRSIFSEELHKKITECLERKEQIMLFLNRRGFAGFVSCRACGQVIKCPHCDVSLSEHNNERLLCHYCGYETGKPRICPVCGSPYIGGFKAGTQQIEKVVREDFPEVRTLRMDFDTTRTKGSYEKILAAFAAHEADILIGTQMIVKGHDFPDVTLMGIVAADLSLNAEDYRCAERTFQLLCQAVGRGGRGEKPGEAVIQTYHPDHYSIQAAAVQDYQAFYEEEMSYRMLLDYPPAAHMLAVLGSGPEDEKLVQAMYYLKLYIERIYRENDLHIIGPAYASVGKVKDIYRQVIYLKHKDHKTLVHIKDQLEKYIEINSGFRKIYIQFDFS